MTPPLDHRLLSNLLLDALDHPTGDRAAWLAAIDDPALRTHVSELLRAHEAAERLGHLEHPVALPIDPFVGRRIGPWRLVERVGEGGMGTVFRAERADGQYERTVAVKLLHPGPNLAALARRLRAECQIVATLEHPHIARLYDSGLSDEGLPYLALEYVDGTSITGYASAGRLDLQGRLALFLQVCDAVSYAHRHLVVHRDLKPSNVLVAASSDAPTVRLVDFGIAKLLVDDGLHTLTHDAALTPAYAAPEQLTGGLITTATDVYALGMLLYELLTEQRPYDLTGKTAAQIERTVCNAAPQRPSLVAPPPRARVIKGDLDTIILKALEKDPNRRYPSADELAADIRRYQEGFPIEARPATVGYRINAFLRRHRTGVTAAAGVFLVLTLLILNYTIQLRYARDQARQAAAEARSEAVRAEAVARFMEQILRAPNNQWYVENKSKGPDTPIRVVLDEAAARIDSEFADRPDIRADLHHILGDTYNALNVEDRARYHHLETLRLRETLYEAPDPRLAEAVYYAGMYAEDATDVLIQFRRAAAMLRQRPGGNNLPFLLQSLASHVAWAGRYAEADSLLHEAEVYAEQHFLPGTDAERYRVPILHTLAIHRIESQLALQNAVGVDRARARADSLVRLELPGTHALRNAHACVEGMIAYQRADWPAAESYLRTCLETDLNIRHHYRAALQLIAQLDTQGREREADPYRDLARRAAVFADSLTQAYEALPR